MSSSTAAAPWLSPEGLHILDARSQDHRITYRDVGSGPPVLLLMGLGADSAAWEPHVACWSQRFRCIVPDNRGAGGSGSPPGDWSTADLAEDAARLLDHLGVEAAAVVGISMGGAVAQQLGLRHPTRVTRLVLVASWARCDAHSREVLENLAAVRASVPGEVFTQLLQLWIASPSWFATNIERFHLDRQAPSPMTRAAFARQVAACVTHDTLAQLPALRVPTLVTAGRQDIFIRPELSAELAEGISGAELVGFPGGHIHHWEDLDSFNGKVAAWLQK